MGTISTTYMMYAIIGLLCLLIALFVIYIIRQKTASSARVITYSELGEPEDSTKNRKAELRRRASAGKRIEKEINEELANQFAYYRQYITELKEGVNQVEKKIFFDLTKTSETNPSGLFGKLAKIFNLSEYSAISYCRRNNTTFGADDFFIITRDGFAFGDSNGSEWELGFNQVDNLEIVGGIVDFDLVSLDFDYIVYSPEDIDNFVSATNRYLRKYKSERDIYFEASFEAGKEMALEMLSHLCSKLGETPYGWYVRALYHYSLAKDGENQNANLQKAVYSLNDAEKEVKEFCKREEVKSEESWFYGHCEILMAKIELLRGDDHHDINNRLKNIMGSEVPKEVSRVATSLSTKLKLD